MVLKWTKEIPEYIINGSGVSGDSLMLWTGVEGGGLVFH